MVPAIFVYVMENTRMSGKMFYVLLVTYNL